MKAKHLGTYCILACLFFMNQVGLTAENKICARNLSDVKQFFKTNDFPLQWIETSMSDGKPLLVDISETENGLSMEFNKTDEGLWAKGSASICESNGDISATISEHDITVGKAAPWIMRSSLKSGATFSLVYKKERLSISTGGLFGWSGTFIARH